ncbi:MucR family transcriptional regulator [Methylobacterium hispanicum]|uniref:MucR family transcriptional regulator n=1 Tax=Methylobacterium hispanicum TaxID=270350 RepID=UPI003AF6F0C7
MGNSHERSHRDREVCRPGALDLTAGIVCAYVSNISVPAAHLSALIVTVHATLSGLASGGAPAGAAAEPEIEKPTPAQIRKSITPDALMSFIDGRPYKTLRRHLTKHGLDVNSYRKRYGLPADYPTTSANYSAQRSALAKSLGLGRGGVAATEESVAEAAKPKPRSCKPAETQAAA